jgi:LSD1 subclass zinc finger protein
VERVVATPIPTVATHLVECSQCGAPLPASTGGAAVTCASCGHVTAIGDADAAMAKAKASRADAEALYATLGAPPTISQRIAVVLVNKWAWIAGLPFMYALVAWFGRMLAHLIEAIYEHVVHARLLHVATPPVIWLLTMGSAAVVMFAILVWSLFGERVDARRDLQAALASVPPETEGGPARCRHCSAPLVIPAGALGVRCDHCGADNLVQIPADWIKPATKLAADLQLGAAAARAHAAESRRRVRRAAMWRVPIALGVLALAVVPALTSLAPSDFSRQHYAGGATPGTYGVMYHLDHGRLGHELRPYAACAMAPLPKQLLESDASRWCERTDGGGTCDTVAVFALTRGETFVLAWSARGAGSARLVLAPRYDDAVSAMYIGYLGDEPLKPLATGANALEVPIEISGWYRLDLTTDRGAVVVPCVR